MLLPITDQEFTEETAEGLVMAQFWAPWCGPCRMQSPILEQISEGYVDQIKFVKINVDENPETSQRYGIMSIPNMILLKDGEVVENIVGLHQKEQLKIILDKYL
ncbi:MULTISPECIES: thioredoxin [Vagococcus]|uniref:Thioredoxin n=1 Tax=Vagococcus fluvialis bH819 TaxID=1255619 RepID=A0A1X6WLR1_9ENTE|nr:MULTISPECIES: thioredoxin [Vagococcus]SLM85205.1 Thioredoxin [Vagococcus fluvialis bH819]HCM88382.1 thioredoxin [Vagococcus sp.]